MFRQHTARRLALATLAALAVIILGALFCIAPVWQFPTEAAPYRALTAEGTPPPDAAKPAVVNINTAGEEELMTLPEVGPARAQASLPTARRTGRLRAWNSLTRWKAFRSAWWKAGPAGSP